MRQREEELRAKNFRFSAALNVPGTADVRFLGAADDQQSSLS
jgi:hypothetical protein